MQDIRTRSVSAKGLSFALDEAGEGDTVALLLDARDRAQTALPKAEGRSRVREQQGTAQGTGKRG